MINDCIVDLLARHHLGVKCRTHYDILRLHRWWIVTFVCYSHQLIFQTEEANDFSRARKGRNYFLDSAFRFRDKLRRILRHFSYSDLKGQIKQNYGLLNWILTAGSAECRFVRHIASAGGTCSLIMVFCNRWPKDLPEYFVVLELFLVS